MENTKIQWELIDCLGKDSGYDQTWAVNGVDDSGQKYTAIASVSCGEIVEVEEIEIVKN